MYKSVFSNSLNDDLDKMAQQINAHKKNINKQAHTYDNQSNEIIQGINYLSQPSNSKFLPQSFNTNYGLFSSPNSDDNKTNPNPNPNLTHVLESGDSMFDNTNMSMGSGSDMSIGMGLGMSMGSTPTPTPPHSESMNTMDIDSVSMFSDTSTYLTPKIKKKLRINTNHINHIEPNDNDAILTHVKKCFQCRQQLLSILNESDEQDKDTKSQKQSQNQTQEQDPVKSIILMKEGGMYLPLYYIEPGDKKKGLLNSDHPLITHMNTEI